MIVLVRIDDRLIHGQVATTWFRSFDIEQVIVVADEIAGHELQKTVLDISAPAGIKIHLFYTDEFIEKYHRSKITRRTMLIFTNPREVLRCIEGGVEIPYLNVGGMRYAPGKKKITKTVSVFDEDIVAFKELIQRGIVVENQMMANDKILPLEKYLP